MISSKVLEESKSVAKKIAIFNEEDKNPYEELAKKILSKKIKHVVTVARGTSDCAALFSSYLFAKSLGLITFSLPPSLITLENSKFNFKNTLVFVISQSGLSKDLISCEKACRKMGGETIIMTNNPNSPMVKSANYFFYINAGKEVSIAATKTFILSLLNIIKFVAIIKNDKKTLKNILKLPEHLEKEANLPWNAEIIDKNISSGFIISRGLGYALSTEISLKF